MELKLRPAQEKVLAYESGRMAVSAVPGSGKTFVLTLLATKLIAEKKIDIAQGQEVLIVTYLNASVDNFKSRISKRLRDQKLAPAGYNVRTLHSLAREIIELSIGGEEADRPIIMSDGESTRLLTQAIDFVRDQQPDLWQLFITEDTPKNRSRWQETVQRTAKAYIRTAKNERFTPSEVYVQLDQNAEANNGQYQLTWLLNGVYARYQTLLQNQAAFDFDDLIWQAADLMHNSPDLVAHLRKRWPYVLEDEAQDSVPLQEVLLSGLTGEGGNWVRVGDPNQAITSTFTAAHPRFFNGFIDSDNVVSLPLPNSGRCAPTILEAANRLVHWTCDAHPVAAVKQHAFRRQDILPAPEGDGQPNPEDGKRPIVIRVYEHREDEEIPKVAMLAQAYSEKFPERTCAILVPTNNLGYKFADKLDELDARYDNLLRGGTRERQVAAVLYTLLAILANPLDRRSYKDAYAALRDVEHPVVVGELEEPKKFYALLESISQAESFIFPTSREAMLDTLPKGVATNEDIERISAFSSFLHDLFSLRELPIEDLTLSLADELFARKQGDFIIEAQELDLSIAYQISMAMRQWQDLHPDWRLPDMVTELGRVAEGRARLPMAAVADAGYEPHPGRIALTTQHSAKGLEWDAVFLMGVDGYWVPSSLDAYFQGVDPDMGGDPTAEAMAQLRHLMTGDASLYAGASATESAHAEIICERLRLLYVGITRARRFLHISRSRKTRAYTQERDAEPATAMGAIYTFLKEGKEDA